MTLYEMHKELDRLLKNGVRPDTPVVVDGYPNTDGYIHTCQKAGVRTEKVTPARGFIDPDTGQAYEEPYIDFDENDPEHLKIGGAKVVYVGMDPS